MSPTTSDIDVNALMRGLVHELRNPLSAILTATSLLQPNPDVDEESAMLLDVVKKESRRMNRILTEFSSFVKPPTPQLEDFDLAALVRDVTRELHKDKVVPQHIVIHDELPTSIWVQGDSLQTAQVLRHVLTNAVEAMESGGELRLVPCHQDVSTDICIEDTGAGLGNVVLEKAFQPFFSTKPTSTGLGLSISRGLLRSFGGELTLENLEADAPQHAQAHHGARVRLFLPAANHANPASDLDTD